jgi:two-component system nitrogen regulation response regulator NtrX
MKLDILVVDDEKDIRDLIAGILEDEGYQPRLASCGTEALKEIEKRQPSLVILDVWLGDSERDGLKILEQIKRDHPFVPVIMISGHGTIDTAVTTIKKGAYDFVEKPFNVERLLLCIERAIETSILKRENDQLKMKTDESFVTAGQSSATTRLKNDIQRLSQNDSRIIIEGAVGSGKEAVAKEIHNHSARFKHPFVVLSTGNISPIHLDAELFGVDIVGLSKDQPRKIGLLEQAHNGTIYIDEISLLPLQLQYKLVKFLHDGAFVRLGSSEQTPVNVRVIVGTSVNLAKAIAEGNMREDLYCRLNVTSVHVPSIMERLTDLSYMIDAISRHLGQAKGLKVKRFSEEAFAFLQMYHWPRNLSELSNVVEFALMNANDGTSNPISVENLPVELVQGRNHVNKLAGQSDIVVLPIKEAREMFEKEYLQAQVNRFSGNITQTAKFIGMERSALHRKLKALGLDNVRDTLD